MVKKLHICEKVYFDQVLDFPILLLTLNAGFFSIPSGCQTVWIQIRSDIFVGPDLDPNCLQMYQLMTKELNTEQLDDTTFWLKLDYSQFYLAPTFSIWLKFWLQQILSQGKP